MKAPHHNSNTAADMPHAQDSRAAQGSVAGATTHATPLHPSVAFMDYAAGFNLPLLAEGGRTRFEVQITGNACLVLLAASTIPDGAGAQIFINEIGHVDPTKAHAGELENAFRRVAGIISEKAPNDPVSGLALIIRDGRVLSCSMGRIEALMVLPGGLFESLTLKRMHDSRIGKHVIDPKSLGPLPFRPGCRILALAGDALGAAPINEVINAALEGSIEQTTDSLVRKIEPIIRRNNGSGAGCLIACPSSIR